MEFCPIIDCKPGDLIELHKEVDVPHYKIVKGKLVFSHYSSRTVWSQFVLANKHIIMACNQEQGSKFPIFKRVVEVA